MHKSKIYIIIFVLIILVSLLFSVYSCSLESNSGDWWSAVAWKLCHPRKVIWDTRNGNHYIGNTTRETSQRGTNSETYVAASKWQILSSLKNINNSNQNKTDSINKTSPAAMLKMYSIRKYSFLKDHGYIEPFTQSNNGNNWEHFPSRNDIVLTINKNTHLPSNIPSDYLLKVIWKSSVLVWLYLL